MNIYGISEWGEDLKIFEPVTLGFPSRDKIGLDSYLGTLIGDNAVLRSGTIIYCDVTIGNNFQTGHNVLIRENTRIGNDVRIGTSVIIEDSVKIDDGTNIQSAAYLPTGTIIGKNVFIAPNVTFTNDKYPPNRKNLKPPVVKRNAVIGANATILPGIVIGEGALIGAGAVVTHNVPAYRLAVGNPAQIKLLPEEMSRAI